nr:unnamed protein product [Callosobruchus analis]
MKLHQINLSPRVIVADQGPNNRNAFKRLGATKENPVMMINEEKVLLMFDTPHLLKSLRNNLMNIKVAIIIDGIKINWEDFEKTYIIDKRSCMGRSMVKITHKQVHPNTFEKMKVRYAVQVFSNYVCAAIVTVVATSELNSKTAINTAQCFKKINNIFDCLNSRSLKDSNPYRQGLSIYNKLPYTTLVDALEHFKKKLKYLKWTIKAVSILWDNLQKGVKYFLTFCLNQDPLENLFSVIRNRGGYDPQPTAREFRIALQHNMHIRLQNSNSSNCEVDDNELLDATDLNTDCNEDCNNIEAIFQSLDSSQEHLEQCSQPLGNSDATCPDTEDIDLLITEIKAAQEYFSSALGSDNEESPFPLESCSVAYIAGYLGKFLIDKVNCPCTAENVSLDAMDLSHTDTLIFHRDFGNEEDIRHLKKPTVFDTLFEQAKTEHCMMKKLKTSVLNHLQHHTQLGCIPAAIINC